MRTSAVLIAAGLLAALSVQAGAAISDPVKTDAGQIAGVTLPSGIRVFKGIPFGAPPVGNLRWREPQPVEKWSGVRKADTYGNVCVQPSGGGNRLNVSVDLPDSPKASEDCLYLNVWTGANKPNERRPVMVWIFGGAYSEGAGSSPHNEGEPLAKKGVVYVSFNYRLGPFGFYQHPELTKESGRNASGNYALLDTIAVLRWVQNNIAQFGGDPRNVTIFGESAGSSMSALLVASPLANGLFHRAITQSGAYMGLSMNSGYQTLARAEQPQAGRGGGAPPPLRPLAELRAASTQEISKTLRGSGPIIDGYVLREQPHLTFENGRQNPIDVIAGSNKDEGSFSGAPTTAQAWIARVKQRWGDLADAYLKEYPAGSDAEATESATQQFRDEMFWHMRMYAEKQAKLGRKAWVYYFTHEPPYEPGKRNLKATHTAEIPYALGTLAAPRVFPDASSPELTAASPAERAFSDKVMGYWTNFARSGDPNGRGLEPWPAFKDRMTSQAMILGASAPPTSAAKLALYDQLYARNLAALRGTR